MILSGRPWREAGFTVLDTIATASATAHVEPHLLWIWVLYLSCWAQTTCAEKTPELVATIIRYVNKPEGDRAVVEHDRLVGYSERDACPWASGRALAIINRRFLKKYLRHATRKSLMPGGSAKKTGALEILRNERSYPGPQHGLPSLQNLVCVLEQEWWEKFRVTTVTYIHGNAGQQKNCSKTFSNKF
ncbi:hypothetical protein BD289DRAFT_47409 [Coniella lustricola]|uniref:Uncharacterized protein n=1 Tax=Coniella lustricola TaxID=2025994 RepID=A0A2T3AIE3_9PEZI|nr:hypothetical protein BD289DRAFT_47409 [Coniella lustricola]